MPPSEKIPDGPTTKLMQELAKKHAMVIVVPIYEEDITGVYYNTAAVIDADGKYLGKYRKSHIPQVAGFYEKFFFKPGNLGYPGLPHRLLQARRLYLLRPPLPGRLARAGPQRRRIHRQSVRHGRRPQPVSVGAGAARLGRRQWLLYRRGQPRRHRAALEHRQLLRLELFRQSARPDHRQGSERQGRAAGRRHGLDMVREVRNLWQFFRDRRPETYAPLTQA